MAQNKFAGRLLCDLTAEEYAAWQAETLGIAKIPVVHKTATAGSLQGKRYTYDDWRRLGYQVMQGAKAVTRNALGQAVFDRHQVLTKEAAKQQQEKREFVHYAARQLEDALIGTHTGRMSSKTTTADEIQAQREEAYRQMEKVWRHAERYHMKPEGLKRILGVDFADIEQRVAALQFQQTKSADLQRGEKIQSLIRNNYKPSGRQFGSRD